MHYPWDPRLKTYEELKATEFISQKIVDQIMKSIVPDKKGKLTNQSWLIYGARGMGKSHVLTLIYHKIKEDQQFNTKWIPIICPEELFTVNSLYRLFKKFASLILSELECQKTVTNCNKFITEIETIDKTKTTGNAKQRKEQENELTDQYLNIFLEIVELQKKKFIFLIENLQEVFNKQINEDDQKRLRDIFYQYPGLMIWISSAVQIPGKLADYGKPFYHFFRTRKLEGMNSDEIMKMLYNLCDLNNKDHLRKNLQEMKSDISVFGLLSGGNPRLIIMLYKFLENGEIKGIKDMMKIFISDLTPYFQKETESLAHQQRLIIDSLCLHIFPLLSTKDIGESCNLPDNIVNAQVNKLKGTHWLRTEKVDKLKNDLFIMNEYIYRVWYQMRIGGIYQEKASWISEFLSFIYPAKRIQKKIGELENLTLKGEHKDIGSIRSELEIFKKALEWQEKDEVKRYFELLKNTNKEPSKELLEIRKLIENDEFEKALSLINSVIKKNPKINYFVVRGHLKASLNKHKEAIEDYSKAIESHLEDAFTYNNRGYSYSQLNQSNKAIEDYSKAIDINPNNAFYFHRRGNEYLQLEYTEKAIKDYNRAIELNPEDAFTYCVRAASLLIVNKVEASLRDFQLFIVKIDYLPTLIERTFDVLFTYIEDNYKASDSIQKLFVKGISKKERLKHILFLTYFKQNEIIQTYLSENGFVIFKGKENPYPLMISFTALFNLIESIKTSNPKYEEFAMLWLDVVKNIKFEDEEQNEDIFSKSLMLIYAFAIKDKASSEIAIKVLKLINKEEYHSIPEPHFYIPTALIDEKDSDVQRLMKDPIFKETVEKIKIQREQI